MRQALEPTGLPTRHALLDVLDEEYCTVVFRLRGGRPSRSELLVELSQYVESAGTVEIVRFHVGNDLDHPHA
ncbi:MULTISPECIES: hypothetical protein [unclassified Pseudomonas]|uniref:hypothetical protein n=1 Tax=unclassified Pseudomonas TaxID=196821 RepID=UPI0005D45E56|nr:MULTISPECIES: hypothetical protein [unclassified Pseudomonas]KJH75909.1 hypothetical protein UB23_16550 [Pseudomonas sp. ES3-33]MCH4880912.1 hypothetical protein [Pseudomonas sp. TMW22090]